MNDQAATYRNGAGVRAIREAIARCREDTCGAVADLLEDRALSQAMAQDISAGDELDAVLFGRPYLAKSLFEVEGAPTFAGGPRHPDDTPAEADADAVAALIGAGAVLIGATHMDEYAYGFLGVNPHHGRVMNPRYPACFSGGSSSGSAAAVAAGLVGLALGSDTNGSIRIPAALCGVYGFKPAFGAVSGAGMRNLAPSLDHVGWIGESIDVLEAAWRASARPSAFSDGSGLEPQLRVVGGELAEWVDRSVWSEFRTFVATLESARPIELAGPLKAFHAAAAITSFEAAKVHGANLAAHPDRYSSLVAAKLRRGASMELDEYTAALREREELRSCYLAALGPKDVLMLPTLPIGAPRAGARTVRLRSLELRTADALSLLVRPFSLTGLPALTVPGSMQSPGFAVQLVALPGSEPALWAAARICDGKLNAGVRSPEFALSASVQ